jgi:hypothetical protein
LAIQDNTKSYIRNYVSVNRNTNAANRTAIIDTKRRIDLRHKATNFSERNMRDEISGKDEDFSPNAITEGDAETQDDI